MFDIYLHFAESAFRRGEYDREQIEAAIELGNEEPKQFIILFI